MPTEAAQTTPEQWRIIVAFTLDDIAENPKTERRNWSSALQNPDKSVLAADNPFHELQRALYDGDHAEAPFAKCLVGGGLTISSRGGGRGCHHRGGCGKL